MGDERRTKIVRQRQSPRRDVIEHRVDKLGAPLEQRFGQPLLRLLKGNKEAASGLESVVVRRQRSSESPHLDSMAAHEIGEIVKA